MPKIKRAKDSAKPTFQDWNFDILDRTICDLVNEKVRKDVAEAILNTLDSTGVEAVLDMEESNPLKASVFLPLGDGLDEPALIFNLSEVIEQYLDEEHDAFFDGQYATALVAELRRLADKIELAARKAS